MLRGWKKTGQTAVSIGYFITLLTLFAYIAIQGPIVTAKIGPSSNSILRNNLFPFSLADMGLLNSPAFGMIDFASQIILGFLSAYLIARTFQELFDLSVVATLLVTLVFLSPYYSPLVFGVHVINNGYAYPVFLLTVRYLLRGLIFKEFSSYLLFFFFTAIAIILRRQFVFLPVVGIAALVYSLIFDYEEFYGKKIFLGLALLASIFLPDLSERYANYLKTGQFVSIPFVGFQMAVTPLYVSKVDDVNLFTSKPELANMFLAIRQPLAAEGLTQDVAERQEDIPLMRRYRNFFETYETIAYGKLKPLIEGISRENPALVDEGLITLAMGLIFANFGQYFLIYLHNIIYHMGGYFMTVLFLLIFITSFIYHIQYKGRFSLVSLVITFLAFSNYILVALLEPVTQEYGFYTDSFTQALLLALIAFLFRTQRGKTQMNEESPESQRNWRGVEKPT